MNSMNRAIAKHLCVGLAGCLSIGANALFAVPAPQPCATNDYAWHFAKGSDSLGWTTMNYRSCAVTNGQLEGVTTCGHGKTSPFLFSPTMELDTSRYGVLRFIATSDLDYPAQGVVLFRRKGEKFNDENRLAFLFKGGGRPCVYSLDLTKHKNWSGTAEQFRFVMCYQDGVKIEIPYIAVLKTPAAHDVLRNGSFEEFALGNSIEAWSVASSGVAASLAGERHTDGRQSLALAGKGACVVHTSAGLNFLNPGDAWVFSMDYLPAGGTGHLKVTWIFSDALEKEIGRQAEVITLKAAQAFQA